MGDSQDTEKYNDQEMLISKENTNTNGYLIQAASSYARERIKQITLSASISFCATCDVMRERKLVYHSDEKSNGKEEHVTPSAVVDTQNT